jgi:hypothetical protein
LISRRCQGHKFGRERAIVDRGQPVRTKLFGIIDRVGIRQKKDLGDLSPLRADIEQCPLAIASNPVMLCLEIESWNVPDGPAINRFAARSFDLSDNIVKAGGHLGVCGWL